MNVHEYQAKEILKKFNVPCLRSGTAKSAGEARSVAEGLGGSVWVVKAQIHAGGRGKGGGVKLAKSLEEVEKCAGEILGMTLVTHQTGPEGKKVNLIFIEEGCDIKQEFYAAVVVDRDNSCVGLIASAEGGMDIEEVAAKTPEKIMKVSIDPASGFSGFHGRRLAFGLGLTGKSVGKAVKVFHGLYNAFVSSDCSIAEINPLVLTGSGDIIALDAKMNFDDNGLFRHPDIVEMRDLSEEDPTEVEATDNELAYIKLDGTIGCLVNGAGLAMATMDIIKIHGGEPANFLDVGGGADKERVTTAFKIILTDPKVKAILVNIFGGIMKCDVIADGVVAASKEIGLKVPLVVRLAGTNEEQGKKILAESGLNIIPASGLTEAAQKVVESTKGA